jgi:hypothetical protein
MDRRRRSVRWTDVATLRVSVAASKAGAVANNAATLDGDGIER